MKVEFELSFDVQLIKHSIRNGFLCGLWALIPGLIILLTTEGSSLISLAGNFLMLIILFPAIICITCLAMSSTYRKTSEIITACLICSIVSIIWMNTIVQFYIKIFSVMNDLETEIDFGAIFELSQILLALFAGLFSSIIRIANPVQSIIPLDEEAELSDRPAKPNWDPRIEKLKAELHQTNSNLKRIESQLRKEIWQNQK